MVTAFPIRMHVCAPMLNALCFIGSMVPVTRTQRYGATAGEDCGPFDICYPNELGLHPAMYIHATTAFTTQD